MWIVAKIKSKDLSTFKRELSNRFDDKVKYYFPKIFSKNRIKNSSVNLLGNYIFCFHDSFRDIKNLITAKYTKGLDYFLDSCVNSQPEIIKFISFCRENESSDGFINQEFFDKIILNKGKFVNSPLANLVFEIIGKEKKYLNILIGKREIKISKKSNIFYLPA